LELAECVIRAANDRGAELRIVHRRTSESNVPYYRLYAVVDGKRHFLMDRNLPELDRVAAFIALHTGWRVVHDSRRQ